MVHVRDSSLNLILFAPAHNPVTLSYVLKKKKKKELAQQELEYVKLSSCRNVVYSEKQLKDIKIILTI